MPTPITAIRNDNAYIAAGKQSVAGTPVAPSVFFRWLDGSSMEPDLKTVELMEGDGSRHVSQVFKAGQKWKVKLVVSPRPNELGFLEAAAAGASSDAYTAPAFSSTISAPLTAGVSTSISLSGVTGLPGSGTIALMLDKGLSTEEIVLVSLPASGNSVTIANSAKIQQSHLNGATIQSIATHLITDANDGAWYTFEVGLGSLNGGAGETFRLRDCKVDSIKRNIEKGKEFTLEVEISGIACTVQVSPSTIILENRQIFLFTAATYTLNGSTVGDALNIYKADLEQKNNLDTEIYTTAITPAGMIFGKYDLKTTIELWLTQFALVNLTYFGTTAGTTDANAIGVGTFSVVLAQPDGFHQVTYAVATMAYVNTKPPAPKADGKAYSITVEGVATSNMGQNAALLSATVLNGTVGAY